MGPCAVCRSTIIAITWKSSADMGMTRSRLVLDAGDDEQRDDFAVGALVLADAGVCQLDQFLDPHAGVPQDLHVGPLPERGFLVGQRPDLPGLLVAGAPERDCRSS